MPSSPTPPRFSRNERERYRSRSPPPRYDDRDRERPGSFRDRPLNPRRSEGEWDRNANRTWDHYNRGRDSRDEPRPERRMRVADPRDGRDAERHSGRDYRGRGFRERSRSRDPPDDGLRAYRASASGAASSTGAPKPLSPRRPRRSGSLTPEEGQIPSPALLPPRPRSPMRRSPSPRHRRYRRDERDDRDQEWDRDRIRDRGYQDREEGRGAPCHVVDRDRRWDDRDPQSSGQRIQDAGRGTGDRDRDAHGGLRNRAIPRSRSPSTESSYSRTRSQFSSPYKRDSSPPRLERRASPFRDAHPRVESLPLGGRNTGGPISQPEQKPPVPLRAPPSGPKSERLPSLHAVPTGPKALAAYSSINPIVRQDTPSAQGSPATSIAHDAANPYASQGTISPVPPPPLSGNSAVPPSGPRLSWSERKRQPFSEFEAQTVINPYAAASGSNAQLTPASGNPSRYPAVLSKAPQEIKPMCPAKERAMTTAEVAEMQARKDEARILSELPPLQVQYSGAQWESELASHHAAMQTLQQQTLRAQSAYRMAAAVLADAEMERAAAGERRRVTEAALMTGTLGVGMMGAV